MQAATPLTRATIRRGDGRREHVEVTRAGDRFVVAREDEHGRRSEVTAGSLAAVVAVCAASDVDDDGVAASLAAGCTVAAGDDVRRWFAAHHALRVARQTCNDVPPPPRGPDLVTLAREIAADVSRRLPVVADVRLPIGRGRVLVELAGHGPAPFLLTLALSPTARAVTLVPVGDVGTPTPAHVADRGLAGAHA